MSGAVDNTSGTAAPYKGNILLGTTLAFGILAFLVVTLRVVFRATRRKIGISDYCIATAMVSSLGTPFQDLQSDSSWFNANTKSPVDVLHSYGL